MAHLHADLGHAAARAGAAEHAQDTGQLDRGLGRVLSGVSGKEGETCGIETRLMSDRASKPATSVAQHAP